jgi:hypothetical protein
MLLGTICENPLVCRKIHDKIPGKTLVPLITAIEEFAVIQDRADELMINRVKNMSASQEKHELLASYAGFSERLRIVARRLKGYNMAES